MHHTTHWLTWIVLIGSIGLLQIHGTTFWYQQIGRYGVGWSLLLEAVALWLWVAPSLTRKVMGAIAWLLLLLGPLCHVLTPVLESAQAQNRLTAARAHELALAEAHVGTLEKQHAVFTENARSRSGWLSAVRETETRLAEARTQLAAVYRSTQQTSWRHDVQTRLVVMMECLGLLLFQISVISAVLQLSQGHKNNGSASYRRWFGLRAQTLTLSPQERPAAEHEVLISPVSANVTPTPRKRARTKTAV
jgi:hypothetical protein